jgi:hypothetical protein
MRNRRSRCGERRMRAEERRGERGGVSDITSINLTPTYSIKKNQ